MLGSGGSLPLPSFAGIPSKLELHHDEEDAKRLAAALVQAGIARWEDWEASPTPTGMLRAVLRRVYEEDHQDVPDEYGLQVFVWDWGTVIDKWSHYSARDRSSPRVVLAVYPHSWSMVQFGPVLERVGPILGAVLYKSLLYTLWRYLYVWSADELDMEIESMQEQIEDAAGEDEAGQEFIEQLGLLKEAATRFEFGGLKLDDFTGPIEHEDPEVQALVQDAWDLYRFQDAVPRQYTDLASEISADWGWLHPPLLFCEEEHDAIVHAFDERYQWDDGMEPGPNSIFVLDPTDPGKLAAAWSDFRLFLYLHARTQDLIHRLRRLGA